jgi:high-affinity iron transporter
MPHNLFSVPIFFIVFRETLEAAIIISSLLGLVKQIIYSHFYTLGSQIPTSEEDDKKGSGDIVPREVSDDEDALRKRRLLRKMRIQECPTLRLRHIPCH